MKRKAEIITEAAWKSFESWVRMNDPDGNMTPLQQATAYCDSCEPSAATIRKQRDEWRSRNA